MTKELQSPNTAALDKTTTDMEDKQRDESTKNKTTGSPTAGSPDSKNVGKSNIEDIWKKAVPGSPEKGAERRRNGLRNCHMS